MVSMLLLYSCEEEGSSLVPFPELEVGTYKIEVYDSSGKFVFSREGEAFHLAPGEGLSGTHIRMDDPMFQKEDVEYKFAYFGLGIREDIVERGSFNFVDDELNAIFYEQWFTTTGDWAYEGTEGSMIVEDVQNGIIKGRFTVSMEVVENESHPFQAHPTWGEKIKVKGYFISAER